MTIPFPTSASTLLFKGGPSLIDLLIDVNELRVIVTGPRMLFERLQLVTTLSAFDGCTAPALSALAGSLEGQVHCGQVGLQKAVIAVESHRAGAVLTIDVGPASMYQSEIVLRTLTGESFRTLLHRTFGMEGQQGFFAGLLAVTAQGHLEHDHGAGHDPAPHPHHGGGGHGHS